MDWRKNAPFSTWGRGSRQLSCGWSRKNKTQTNPPSCRRARSTLVPGILAAGGGDNHGQWGGCAAPGRDPAESLPFSLCDKERQGRGRRRTHTHTDTHHGAGKRRKTHTHIHTTEPVLNPCTVRTIVNSQTPHYQPRSLQMGDG